MTTAHARGDGRLVVPLVAAVAIAVALWAGRPYAVGVFHDDGVYAVLAKALATGQGYRYLHLPGAPAATHYPPGYPFFLSVAWRIWPSFPDNIRLLLAANALLLGAIAVGTEGFSRRVLAWPRIAAASAALVATISYPLILLSSLVLSETLFVALLMPSLMLAERLVREGDRPRAAVWAGICAGLLILVRTHGAALLLAVMVCLALRRRFRDLFVVAAVAAVIVAPWQLWSMTHVGEVTGPLTGSYGSYVSWLSEGARSGGSSLFMHTVALNAREVMALIADRFSLSDAAGARLVTAWLVIVVAAVGAYRVARRAPVTIAFFAIYLGVMLVWPYTPWRFFFAVWPIVVLSIGEPIVAAVRAQLSQREPGRGRTHQAVTIAAGAIILVGAFREEARAYRGRTWRAGGDAATAQIAPVVSWVRANTSPGDVVAGEGEQLLYLFTGRQAVPLTSFTASEYMAPRSVEENATMIAELTKRFPIRYIVTISPPLITAANSLVTADSSNVLVSHVRVIPLDHPAGGVGAYRVDRR